MPVVELVDERIVLVGTAHVSEKSIAEVRETIERTRPDLVAVELDENRMKALTDKKRFEETPITDLVRGGKSTFILAQVMLASFQRRMGEKQGVEPGAEMLAAVESARTSGTPLVLADRDIGITLRRAWAKMGAREKVRLSWEFMKALVGLDPEEVEDVEVDALLEDDVLTVMMEELSEVAPSVTEVLVRERDVYLAKRIQEASEKGKVLAVIGAGHMKGVEDYLRNPEKLPADTKALEVIPKKDPTPARVTAGVHVAAAALVWALFAGLVLPFAPFTAAIHGSLALAILLTAVLALGAFLSWKRHPVTAVFLTLFLGVYAFLAIAAIRTGDYSALQRAVLAYVISTAACTALGAIIGRGHILAILAGAVAAPTKLLHPFVGSGIFPGLVQAWVRKPVVKDLQEVSKLQTLGDLYKNRATHVLIVTSFAQLGADIGFYVVFPLALAYGVHV